MLAHVADGYWCGGVDGHPRPDSVGDFGSYTWYLADVAGVEEAADIGTTITVVWRQQGCLALWFMDIAS